MPWERYGLMSLMSNYLELVFPKMHGKWIDTAPYLSCGHVIWGCSKLGFTLQMIRENDDCRNQWMQPTEKPMLRPDSSPTSNGSVSKPCTPGEHQNSW